MGNGALPNGPSYRAHPRLYHLQDQRQRVVLALNGVQNGPGPSKGFVPTLKDAKAAFSEAWRGRLEANNVFLRENSQDDPLAPLGRLGLPDGNGRPERERAKTAAHSADFIVISAHRGHSMYGTQRPLFR